MVRIKLPVEQVLGRSDFKRIAEDRCSTMRGGTQPYNLWTDGDRLVVTVLCPVIESNLYAHPPSCGPRLELLSRFSLRYKPVKAPKLSRNLLLQGYLVDVLSEGQFSDPFQYAPRFFGPTTACNQNFSVSRVANVGLVQSRCGLGFASKQGECLRVTGPRSSART